LYVKVGKVRNRVYNRMWKEGGGGKGREKGVLVNGAGGGGGALRKEQDAMDGKI